MSDNTRLIRHQANIYKVRINFATSSQELCDAVSFEAIKPAIRAVLYAEERGRTISQIDIGDFIVSCTKKYWKASERLGFKQHDKILEAYPYLLVLTVDFKHPQRSNTERSTVSSRKPSLGSNNSCCSKRQPVVVLSRLNIPSNQIRSSKRQPVIVLDKLNLPVSKKPDKGYDETQRRTSPRRKQTDLDLDFDSSPEKRKRYRDAIADENLPFCRAAKITKLGSKKKSSSYDSPRKAFKENIRNLNSEDSREIETHRNPVCNGDSMNHTGFDGLRSPRQLPSSRSTGLAEGLTHDRLKSPRRGSFTEVEGSLNDGRLDTWRSPRRRLQGLPSSKEHNGVTEDEETAEDAKGQRPLRSDSPKEKHKRTSSGLWSLLETLMTPVKMFTRRRTK